MPDVELLKFPSREGASSLQDQEDRQMVCPSRRRSCALVNTPSPCVNKAVCHIQELKRKLESWWQLHPRSDGKHLNSHMLGLRAEDGQDDGLPKDLCIEGIGLFLGDTAGAGMNSLRKETMDVLMEVAYLINRLEADRQDAKEALQRERQTNERLGSKMDSLAVWRQQEFPAVVQREHENSMRDISELMWHVTRKKQTLEKVKERVIHTEVLHQRLVQDIDFVKKHGPLVKEKLVMESEIMMKIKSAQIEADDVFAKTTESLKQCEGAMKKEDDDIQKEKIELSHELSRFHLYLKERRDEFEDLKAVEAGFKVKIKETEEIVTKIAGVCNKIFQRIPALEEEEKTLKDEVEKLKFEIEKEAAEIAALQRCISDLQKQITDTSLAGESKVAELEEDVRQRRKELMAVQEETKEQELEIEDYTKKIGQNEQAIKQLQVDMKRLLLKINQNEKLREKIQEDLTEVMGLHCATKTKLEDLEQTTFLEEQKNKKLSENVKKKIMVEMKAIAILKGNISTAKEEYNNEKAKTDKEMEELQGEFEKAASTTTHLELEVKELTQIYQDKTEETEKLKIDLANIKAIQQNCSDEMKQKRDEKLKSLNEVKELHSNVSVRYEDAKARIQDLRSISIEYREESDMMERTAKVLPALIEELQSICDGVQYKHERALAFMGGLRQDITECETRTLEVMEAHNAHLKERRAFMHETKAHLREALQENVRLAHEYRDLQKALMNAKREAVFIFDQKNRAEVSFQDRKQLSLLQKRMHKAMVKYFNHRSLHSQAELAYFQTLSNAYNQKITTVQEELSEAIQRLSAFLHSLTDDSTATGDDDANKQSSLDANGLSGEMPAVQIAV
ncbi:coiled-coil domain-containing protein 178 isoform X2 [Engraulis encrasicolus]|uniref:coiled-coil domain-containing protein 178 isoform X2 n=1 Tax=Engraulis encrasicolus TaxID=184585 RepID=UPI002FCFB121